MRGMIGVPHMANVPWEFHAAMKQLQIPDNVQLLEADMAQSVVHIGRESICVAAINEKCDFVLMIDSDMVPESKMIEKMLKHHLPIVSAPCFKRIPPYTPCFYEKCAVENGKVVIEAFKDWPEMKPFRVQAVGAACMMIRTDALKLIPRPWFYPLPSTGEDISFCMKAEKAGVPIYVDPLLRCGHLETRAIYEEHYRGWAK